MTTDISVPEAVREHAANEALAEILFSPEGLADPHSRYHRLREAMPVHRSTLGTWVLTRYDDVAEFLRSKQVNKDVHTWMAGRFAGEWDQHPALGKLAANMLWANPPEHSRLRRIVNVAFTMKRVMAHREYIEQRIAPLTAADGGDACNELCFPLALSVMANLLGLPLDEAPLLRDKIRDFQRVFEMGMTPAELRTADSAAIFLDDYFGDLIRQKQRKPDNALLSALIDAVDVDGERLDFYELVQMCHMIMAAGSETTTFFMTNGIKLLIENPDQADLLRRDPSLLGQAVTEVLRYEPSAHMIPRTTTAPVRLGDMEIPAAARVMVMLAAANRDPDHFAAPDRFDVTRKDSAPIAYGMGIHYCLGWRLANLQAEIVFPAMLNRFTDLEISEPLRLRPRVAFPQVEALPIRFRTVEYAR
jgi:cytochrome P450